MRCAAAIRKRELDAQLRDIRKSGPQRWRAVAVVLPLEAPLLIDRRIFACGELHDCGSIAEGLTKLDSGLASGFVGEKQAGEACQPASPTVHSSTTAPLLGRFRPAAGFSRST